MGEVTQREALECAKNYVEENERFDGVVTEDENSIHTHVQKAVSPRTVSKHLPDGWTVTLVVTETAFTGIYVERER
jgi:hypothetical protein